MKAYFKLCFYISFFVLLNSCSIFNPTEKISDAQLIDNFKDSYHKKEISFSKFPYVKIDSITIDKKANKLNINFDKNFSYMPFREENVDSIYAEINNYFLPNFNNYQISARTLGYDIRELIPNYYRKNISKIDKSRKPKYSEDKAPVVFNASKNLKLEKGLFNKNVAIWHSHGWYYNHKMDRWLWQRARLFQTVEDIGPISFTLPYLVPMLENAGANVFLPRERDTQTLEILLDDTDNNVKFFSASSSWQEDTSKGFGTFGSSIKGNTNPFEIGGYKFIHSDTSPSACAEYIPHFSKKDYYGVYISYQSVPNSCEEVEYTVHHLGGQTKFLINQSIGGGTWIYLGKFKFEKGKNQSSGKLVISNESQKGNKIISTDAVRFGGGVGVIERNGSTSGRPKFVEGARYYLQYAGMPDTLVYKLNDEDDYKDDYQSRGEWVNFLKGNPSGPNKDRKVKGLGIPIDASLAFHTDAGITSNDTTVGTLLIYSIEGIDSSKIFPETYSRLANRDFADIMQTQLVNDIKAKYDPVWNRRQLMEAQYSEAARPNMPSALLELASHQNFLDVRFMSDPRFRFDVSRALYKSILKFVSTQNNLEYVVQPLPVTHFTIERINNSIKLSWKQKEDPLEPTATAKHFRLYTRLNGNDFDNGIRVDTNFIVLDDLRKGKIYSFKITGVNDGGESFPSEILSACIQENNVPTIMIINAFDRIAPPASVVSENFSGFLNNIDEGIPDKYDIGFTGEQHDFNTNSVWQSDDIPGHGASYADYETKIVVGNTFDFPYLHGLAIQQNNLSFVSASDESISDEIISISKYPIIDLIMGEEKTTNWTKPFTDSLLGLQYKTFDVKLQKVITDYLDNGGNLFVSGSYIASDLFLNNNLSDQKFASEVLKYKLASDHAVKNGNVIVNDTTFLPKNYSFNFTTDLNDSVYNAEAPDALSPINGSKTILRYKENFYSAAIAFKDKFSIVAFGFPFETIKTNEAKKEIMKA
ncbi:MAG: N-acetylmuramoyl-L-alanine amidase, partial [Ignavibacteriae bacterium]|nr:N-acetylmuramoyl-L-alanine amidase [Ignavibacteriota bacterium]